MEAGIISLAIKSMMTLLLELAMFFMLPVLAVGLLVAIFQAATQINEQSLSFIPKLVLLFLVVMSFGDLFIDKLVNYTTDLFNSIPMLVG